MADHLRRRRRHPRRKADSIQTLKWRKVVNPYTPLNILSDDQIEAIHRASLVVLRDSGIKFLSSQALGFFREAGAEVDQTSQMVHFDPELVEELIALPPSKFTIAARNPERSTEIGANVLNFATVGGPSFVSDLDRGRRAGTIKDLEDFFKLASQLEIFHFCGATPFEPQDLPAESRHLDKYLAAITHHDRIWLTSMLGAYRARDGIEMLKIVHQLDSSEIIRQPSTIGNINVNSPRQVDRAMSNSLIEFSRFGQPVLVTPFTLLGAMAPTTMAGSLVQQNAEALACIALTQIVRPGAPVIYGSFSSNVDMKSGSPAFGTPEYVRTTLASGQLARRYRLPYRSSNTNASNAPDGQSVYESCMSVWAATLAHANLLLHGGGWLEGGLVASFEKLIIDAEILQIMIKSLEPIPVNEDTLAVEAIADIPPGGHFFGSPHTMQRYQDIFYTPLLSDWRNFETWNADGARHTFQRANTIWKSLLRRYAKPNIDPGILEELNEFISRRKKQIENGTENAVFDEWD